MITLHSAVNELRDLLDQIDPITGELPDKYEPARELVQRKSTAVAAYILQVEREAEMAEEYVKELSARINAHKKRARWLRTYLSEHMSAAGITSIKDERGIFSATLSVGRDKAVEVFDARLLPAEYMRTVPATQEPDKTAISKAIAAGVDVAGARVVFKDRLTIK